MTDRFWNTNPVPLRTSTPLFLNLSHEEVAKGRELIQNTPWYNPDYETSWQKGMVEAGSLAAMAAPGVHGPGMAGALDVVGEYFFNQDNANHWDYLDRDMANEAKLFTDPNAPGEWVRGLFSAWDAAAESMQQDYHRGWTSRNMPHEVWAGKAMIGGRDVDSLKGTILEFGEEAENFLRDRMHASKWNTKFWEDGRFPIANLAMETPEDLLTLEPPEGWDPKDALQFFKEKDPDAYKRYSLALGGEAELERLTKDSRNQYEFFYRLGEQLTLQTVNKSLEVTQRNWDSLDHIGHFVGTLGVHGILNDPDMIASMALSIALAIPTGLGSLVAGGGALALKTGLVVNRGVRLANLSRRAIRGGGLTAQWTRRAQNWLPENIGPHLLRSHVWNGRRFTRYSELSKVKKFGVYTLGNILEGGITGSMAEMANQYQKTSRGVTENWDWGRVATETLFEMALSPIINPIMGGAFKGLGYMSSVPGYVAARSMKPEGLGKYLNNLLHSVKGSMHPQAISRNLKVIDSLTTIQKGLNSIGLNDIGKRLGTIMNTLAANSGLDEVGIAEVLAKSVAIVTQSGTLKNPEMSLIDAIVNNEAFVGEDNIFKAALKGKIELGNNIGKRADKEGISVGEFLENNKDNPEIVLGIDLLPTGELQELHERAGGEAKWNKLNGQDKITHMAEWMSVKQKEQQEAENKTKADIQEMGEDIPGLDTSALGDGSLEDGIVKVNTDAAALLRQQKEERAALQAEIAKSQEGRGSPLKRNIKINKVNNLEANINRLEDFLSTLKQAEELGQTGHLPTHLMETLKSLQTEEKHINHLLGKLEGNREFGKREHWKAILTVFNNAFGTFDVEGKTISLDSFSEKHVQALDATIDGFEDPKVAKGFKNLRKKIEDFQLRSLNTDHLNERKKELSVELATTIASTDALQEVFDQQTDIRKMLESPIGKAFMIEGQAEAMGMIVGRDAIDEGRRITEHGQADIFPTFEEFLADENEGDLPSTEKEWRAFREQQIEKFIEEPVRGILRRGLEKGWRPVTSNAFNAGRKGVWFKDGDVDIFEPLMINVEGIAFDANFNIDEIAMMRTLPSLQTAPNKRRAIQQVILVEDLQAGMFKTPTSIAAAGKARTTEGTIELNESLLITQELSVVGKEWTMENLARVFGHEVGHFQFHKLSKKQLAEFKKLTNPTEWKSPSAEKELATGLIETQESIDSENFAEIWTDILDQPKFNSIFTTHPLGTETELRAFIKREFQDKAAKNGPNRFRGKPPTRRGTVLIPTTEDLVTLAKFVERIRQRVSRIDEFLRLPQHPGGTDTEDLKKKSINKAELEHLGRELFDIFDRHDGLWKNSAAGLELAADGKTLEENRIKFEVAKNEHFRETLVDRDTWFSKLNTVRMLLENKKYQRNSLNTREAAYESLISESAEQGTPLTRKELVKRLPLDSRVRRDWLRKIEEKESYGEGVLTEGKAREIGKREFTKSRKSINRLKIGDLDTSRMVYPPTTRMYNTSPLLNETTDEDLLLVPVDEDYLTAERISEADIAKIQDTEKELEAWISMARQLQVIEGSQHVDRIGTVHAARIYAAMIEGGNDYFYRIGMKPHVVFEKQIHSPEIKERLENQTGNNSGITPLPEAYLNTEAPNLRYRIKEVIEVAEGRADLIRAKVEGWIGQSWYQTIEGLLKDTTTEGRRISLSDHYKALNLLEAMESLQKTAMTDLFKNVYEGYALSLDDTTGRPNKVTIDLSLYTSTVRKSAIARLRDAIANSEFDGARLTAITERLGLVVGDSMWQYFHASETQERMSTDAPFAIDLLLNQYLTVLREDFTIEKFGNGELDYRDATTLGEELVDITFRDRPYPGRNSLEAQEGVTTKSTELHRGDMESTLIRRPHYGEGTAYAGVARWRIAEMVGEYKFRSRAEHVLNTKLDEKRLRAAADWRETLKEHADPDRVGVAGLPVSVRPRVVGATLSSHIISRQKLKDFMLEIFLDMPNIAHSFISDQETVSKETKYFQFGEDIRGFLRVPREVGEGTQTMIGSGENLKVPFGQMGNIAAIELMNPDLEGLGESIMDLVEEDVRKVRTEWETNNPGKEWNLGSMFEAVTTTDQQFSGRYVGKLLALGGDPNGRAKIKKFLTAIKDEPQRWGLKSEEDFYIVSGLLMNNEIFKPSNIDTAAVQGLGKFLPIFKSVENIKTLDEWNARIKELEPGSKERVRLEALREYWKVPTMRRDYDGGIEAFKDDFMPGGKRNEWDKVMVPLMEAFDIETPFTKEEVEALGRLTFRAGTLRNEALIDYALMMTGPEKSMALEYVTLDSSFEFEGKFWRDTLIKSMVPDPSKNQVADNATILSLDNHRQALKETIKDWTYKTYGRIDDTLIAKTEKKYDDTLKEARSYLRRLEEDGKTLRVNTPEWETYQLILHGQIDAEGNEIEGAAGFSYRDIGFFKALNMYNSSAYKLDMPHMEEVSRMLGFQEFSPKDWLGLENHLLYQLFLPTQRSHRTSPVFSSLGMDSMGIKLERVASEKEQFNTYMDEAMEQITEASPLDYALKAGEYIRRNNSNPFGMFDLVDNPYKKMSREEAEVKMEEIMTMHEMLFFAGEDKLPKEVYPEYTAEDDAKAMLSQTITQWKNNSVEMEQKIPEIIKFEEDLYNAGPNGREILKLKKKAGVIYSPSVAQKLEAPQTTFFHREGKQGELYADTVQSPAGIQTSKPKGPLAMMPLTKRHSIMDKGNIPLQRIALQRQIDMKRHWLNKRLDHRLVDENPLLQGTEIGGRSPFAQGTLPHMLDVPTDLLAVLPDNEVGRMAAEIYGKVNSWVISRGVSQDVLADPTMWPYLLNVIETEELQTTLVKQMNRQAKRVHDTSRKRGTIESWRQRWLTELFDITNVSYDIKNSTRRGYTLEEKSMEIGVANVEGLEAETWYNIFYRNRKRGKKASEGNREGYLEADTLLQTSLGFGVIPGGAGMLIRNKRGNLTDNFDFKSTQLRASAIQAHDFMKFLVKLLWNDGVYQVMRTDPMYKKFFKSDMTPDDWTVLPDAMKEDLYIKALEKLKGHKGFTFEARVTEKGLDLYKYTGAKPDMPTARVGDKTVDFNQRNVLGEAGIGFMTRTPTTLQGQTVELVITPESAMQMLSFLENFRLTERVENAAHVKVPYGTKLGEMGQRIRARSDSQIIRDALAPNETEVRETSMIETAAIKTIVDKLTGKENLLTVNTGNRKTSSRGTMEFIDRDFYRLPDISEEEGAPRFVEDYLEAHISPLSKMIANIDWNQTQAFDPELRNDLTTLINATRTASDDLHTSTLIQLSLSLRDNRIAQPDVARAFLDPERFTEYEQTTGYQRAAEIHRRILALRDASSFVTSGFSLFTSPGGREIANLMREFLGETTITESMNRKTIFRNAKQYVATAYKAQTMDEARKNNKSIREITNEELEQIYEFALGEEFAYDPVNEITGIEGDVSDVLQDNEDANFGDGNQLGFDFTTVSQEIRSVTKTHNKFQEWALGTRNNYVIRMGNEIDEAVNNDKINITNKEAQLMRAIIVRQYKRNPLLLDDIALRFSLTEESEMIHSGRSAEVIVGIEGTTREGQRGTRLTAVKVFAHEIVHVGATRFLTGANWITWNRIYNSKVGRQYLRKMVQAWHGGRFDAEARKEYKRYLDSPHEFVAGLASYKLFHATLPEIPNLSSDELKVHVGATRFIKRIMDWFKGHWDRISTVFVNFRQSHPELSKQVDEVTLNTMGYDPIGGPLVRLDNESTSASHKFMTYDTRFGEISDNWEMSNNELMDIITEFDSLVELTEGELSVDQMNRFIELQGILHEGEGAKAHGVTGVSRWHFLSVKRGQVEKFGHVDGKSVDLYKLLNTENPEGIHADPIEKAVAVEVALEAINDVYGPAFRANAGSIAASAANKIQDWRGKEGASKVSGHVHSLLTGQAASNLTWNGWHPLMISLSALVDDRVSMMMGQYSNVNGLPSVNDSLQEIHAVSTILKEQRRIMTDEVGNLAYKLSGRNNFLGDTNTKLLSELDAQIMMKIDNPTHEFSLENLEGFQALKPEAHEKIITAMENSVITLKSYLTQLVKDGQEDGTFGTGFDAVIPYRLNNQINIDDTRLNFKTELGKVISNNILQELSDTEKSVGRIDPIVFMGTKSLPRIDRPDHLRNDLIRIRDTDVNLYNWLMKEFTAPLVISKDGVERKSQKSLRNDLEDKLKIPQKGGNVDPEAKADIHTLNMVMDQWSKILKDLARGKITWSILVEAGVNTNALKAKYETTITDSSRDTMDYLFSLRMDAIQAYVPQFIYYHSDENLGTHFPILNRSEGTAALTPVDLHIHNLVNRASVGMYFPNDIWGIPRVGEVISNPKLKELFVWNPTQITEEFRKGLGDEIHERKMMREKFGIHGTFGDFAQLVQEVIQHPPDHSLLGPDGRELSTPEITELHNSTKVLITKWEMTKGILRRDNSPNKLLNTMADIAPALTRVVFGGNLSLASAIVEGGINVVSELIGRNNLTGTIRGILAPILNVPIANKELRRRVGADIAYHVETLTQSYIPDYEKPANSEADQWYVSALKWGGKQQLRPAQWMMTSIASQRAVSARLFVTDNMDRLTDLSRSIAEKPLDMTNPSDIKGRMRKVGFRMNAVLEQDMGLVRYMLNAGLLEPSTFLEMKRMIKDFLGANPGERYYVINEMHLKQLMENPDNLDYRSKMKVITGLRRVEKEFIHEVILEPKAFDIFTGNIRKGKESGGVSPGEAIWEIFRRHPILFVSQHLFRGMNHKHPLKWGFGLISLLVLDIVYMLSLRMANGEDPEDLIDDLDNNRLASFMQYMSRLPILGRWGSEIGQMVYSLTEMSGQERAGGFISLAALSSALSQIKKAGDGWINDGDYKVVDTINATKTIPLLGQAIIRTGLYTGLGMLGDPYNPNRRARRGSGGGGGGGSQGFVGNYGINAFDMPMTYEGHMRQLVSELTQYHPTPPMRSQEIADFAPPWTGGRNPWDVSRNEVRNSPPLGEDMKWRTDGQTEAQRGMATSETSDWTEGENQYWRDLRARNQDLDGNAYTHKQIDIMEHSQDIRQKIKDQKGTSRDLVDALRASESELFD